ncbi:acyltransferase family protein [Pseudodesulfovibrio piezophilus]|uniref:Acyltransferase 3 domain-containing protein n=1 Tax=Pseudodesulfovibrio piezophilus (strain DSM 21447 / JCM 15486 / C1TLV30) TaxID=1322246 RepID=M1WN84_PSEP2|nr:acyltransferase [Pseudodesulfovibrio piezophilus]CCH50225.1 conserved membrane protein of unknown function [Pseudodesulfovibrio piezophilus C1TLV30]
MGIIRIILAIAVFNSHFPTFDLPIVDGHEAVLSFFAISGFYMALILDTSYETTRSFYASRFMALYPMYLFTLTLSVALIVSLDVHPMNCAQELKKFLTDPAGFLLVSFTSLFIVGQELLFSLVRLPDGSIHFVEYSRHALWRLAPVLQAWSLSLEVIFYAMVPILVRFKTKTLLLLIAASLCAKILIVMSPFVSMKFFLRFFPLEFWLFGGGILAYRVHKSLPDRQSGLDSFAFLLLVGLICVANDVDEYLEPFFLPMLVLFTMPCIFRAFRRSRLDKVLGQISYPFYLIHFIVIAIFETYQDEPNGCVLLIITLMGAMLMHTLFAPGIADFKRRIKQTRPVPSPGQQAIPS